MEVTWNGRIYVDEPQITPEQYKMFFDRCEFGISFDIANSILKNRQEGDLDEVVPADELSYEARDLIKEQVMAGKERGEIEIEGQTLRYGWDYEITEDEEKTSFEDLDKYSQEKILEDMLDNECRWGMW